MFSDRVKITIKSGKGGDGHVSFRREKYVANGGPDGGDGGRGGDVIFVIDNGLNTLGDYRYNKKYAAQCGEEGGKRRCHGKSASDLILKVPEGTIIRDFNSNKIIADMSGDNKKQIILKGGRGGLGNMHFATSTMQVPRYAQPGEEGQELEVLLELKVIADVGLVGFPNVGKSTLLSRVTNANPKVANYHFTTIQPHLGVVDLGSGKGFVMADIPGLIEGASEGVGLGHDFLRHIERTKLLLHIVDASGSEGRDPIEDIKKINTEMKAYNDALSKLPQIIVAGKKDLCSEEQIEKVKEYALSNNYEFYAMSGVTGEGVKELLWAIYNELQKHDKAPVTFEQEFDPQEELKRIDLPFEVIKQAEGVYSVEGPKIEKMLGFTHLDSEKGFMFFQKFIKEQGIEAELKRQGMLDGDTVKVYGWEFEYLDSEIDDLSEINESEEDYSEEL